jgi:prepilin-type N-terminal cleavage/methylation domain-containing protein
MTSRARRANGFTLFEVLAAVAVLALVFTMLAEAAIVGLRSEGVDRRRAEASLIADRELVTLQSALVGGVVIEDGVETKEEEPFRISPQLAPEDVMALLPPALDREIRAESGDLETLLLDERGESRIRRLSVVVEWDETGEEPERVTRISHHLDTAGLEALLPPESDDADGDDDSLPLAEDDQAAGLEELDRMLEDSRIPREPQ